MSTTDTPARTVRMAAGPPGTRDWVRKAMVAGGAELVDYAEAEALVWTDDAHGSGDQPGPTALREILDANPGIKWVQLPWAGVEPYAHVFDTTHVWTCGKGVYARP